MTRRNRNGSNGLRLKAPWRHRATWPVSQHPTGAQRPGRVSVYEQSCGGSGRNSCDQTLNLRPAPKSTKGYDAIDHDGKKYEIKGRRITSENPSRMLSAIRDCNARHFNYLAGVLFNEDFSRLRACVAPFEIVNKRSRY